MPRGFLDLDVQFPRLEGMEDDRARFISIEDHERMMLENLRYILRNIGPDNFNQPEVIAWLLSLGLGKGGERYDMSLEAAYEVQTAGRFDRAYTLDGISGVMSQSGIGLTIQAPSVYLRLDDSVTAVTAPSAIGGSLGGVTAALEVIAPGG